MDAAPISVRPVRHDDHEFLFGLYVARRAPSFRSTAPELLPALLRQQYTAQQASHRSLHPAATHHVVELDGEPIGQCRIGPHPEPLTADATARQPLVLVDLTLHPDHLRLTDTVIAVLHGHAEWFGAALWTDESACTRPDRHEDADPQIRPDRHEDADPQIRTDRQERADPDVRQRRSSASSLR